MDVDFYTSVDLRDLSFSQHFLMKIKMFWRTTPYRLVVTDVSSELAVSIFRVETFQEDCE